jgi:hypothetical protein
MLTQEYTRIGILQEQNHRPMSLCYNKTAESI